MMVLPLEGLAQRIVRSSRLASNDVVMGLMAVSPVMPMIATKFAIHGVLRIDIALSIKRVSMATLETV